MNEGSCRRILIVDDNLSLAENLAEILERGGHEVCVASSAEDALFMAGRRGVDAVVADYRLDGTNGAALVKRLRETQCGLRAMVISACTDDKTVGEAEDAGAAFLSKPLDVALLTGWIAAAVKAPPPR